MAYMGLLAPKSPASIAIARISFVPLISGRFFPLFMKFGDPPKKGRGVLTPKTPPPLDLPQDIARDECTSHHEVIINIRNTEEAV